MLPPNITINQMRNLLVSNGWEVFHSYYGGMYSQICLSKGTQRVTIHGGMNTYLTDSPRVTEITAYLVK